MVNEKRLIQQMAQRLINAFPQADRNNSCPSIYYETFNDIVWDIADEMVDTLDDSSTVDAVEVVRCKDCKHWDVDPDTYGDALGPVGCCFGICDGANKTSHNDFCSHGERKEN